MSYHQIIEFVREKLNASVDEKTKKNSQHFFKEKINFYGVRVPLINRISKESYALTSDLEKAEIFELCEELWSSGMLEESFVASKWANALFEKLEPEDFYVFSRWIDSYINNWASCDTFCNHPVGGFIVKYPQFIAELKEFTQSENRWVRRAAAVSMIVPARKGLFKEDIFEIANLLLIDKDDMVQKGYGWMLKVCSQSYQKDVFNYVVRHKNIMPRTALRYAIEKMPKELKTEAMKR